jgi:hypothetical protein
MALFHPRPMSPQWLDFPPEIRQQVVQLLARLLRQHRRARLPEGEVRHE